MPRAFWKGVISFGLVAIPVKMYVASETRPIAFHYLHKKCLTRPKQVLYCETDNEYFTTREVTRGYEYAKGEYVVLDDNDLEKVPVTTAHSIEIKAFVNADEIDPLYYHSSHYLEPEDLAAKPFALLRQALVKTQRAGIAKATFQRREHLCCLRPLDNIMVLHTMYYQNEIVPRDALTPPRADVTTEELALAMSLVNTLAKSFRPEQYEDAYRKALRKVIEAKVRGEEIKAPQAPETKVPDLMSALRSSIEEALRKAEETAMSRRKK